ADGIDLKRVLENIRYRNRFPTDDTARSNLTPIEIIRRVPADVVVEMTPLNISTGEPALTHIQTALSAGRHVITLNKGPIARAYRKLRTLAESSGKRLLFEGTVMDGFPVFNLVRETLPGCRILGFRGVLNSTTNFILCEMEQGKSFSEALAEARRLGIAEADPDQDLDGWDAAAKTAALINVLMEGAVTPEKVDRKGIRHLNSEDLEKARRQGKTVKLVCEARRSNGPIHARVAPVPLPLNDPLARTEGTSSTLTLFTDLMGPVTLTEENPGVSQTAYAVLSDLLTLLRHIY
ncbi:MAG: homoserine dehydrogenase, partial [Thermodesulfobacteriota bacterium]